MNRWMLAALFCALALASIDAVAADPPTKPLSLAPAPNALAAPVATTAAPQRPAPNLGLGTHTILSPKGFANDDLAAYDDFLHRSIATKRIEIVRFVDRDDRRVFLGITRHGTLGIHVQKRDR